MSYPSSGEQHAPQLPVRQLSQRAHRQLGETEECQRAPRALPIRRGWRVIEADARMPAGLHYLGDGEVLRMISLQMRSDQAHTPLEYLERDSRLYARPLDPPPTATP